MKTKTNDLRKLTTEEINKKIDSLKEELFNLRFKKAIGNLENPAHMRELRKEVARLKTILKEKEIAG